MLVRSLAVLSLALVLPLVVTATAGGHTTFTTENLSEGLGFVEAKTLRVLAIAADRRLPQAPDVPTMQELGYPFVFDSPFGIGGPKGMDPKIVAKLHDAFKKAIEDPALLETLAKYDMVANYKSTADYRKFVTEQIESAKAVCMTCESRQPCLEFALTTNQDSGIWGGTSEEERRKLRRQWMAAKRRAS